MQFFFWKTVLRKAGAVLSLHWKSQHSVASMELSLGSAWSKAEFWRLAARIFLALLSRAGNGRDTRDSGHCRDVGRANGRRQSASAKACWWSSPQPVTKTNLFSTSSESDWQHVPSSPKPTFYVPERISWRMSTTKGADWVAELLVIQGEGL